MYTQCSVQVEDSNIDVCEVVCISTKSAPAENFRFQILKDGNYIGPPEKHNKPGETNDALPRKVQCPSVCVCVYHTLETTLPDGYRDLWSKGVVLRSGLRITF